MIAGKPTIHNHSLFLRFRFVSYVDAHINSHSMKIGALGGDRTHDSQIKILLLYQLSYERIKTFTLPDYHDSTTFQAESQNNFRQVIHRNQMHCIVNNDINNGGESST